MDYLSTQRIPGSFGSSAGLRIIRDRGCGLLAIWLSSAGVIWPASRRAQLLAARPEGRLGAEIQLGGWVGSTTRCGMLMQRWAARIQALCEKHKEFSQRTTLVHFVRGGRHE